MSEDVKYQVLNILLLDSQFKRNLIIKFDSSNIKNNVQIESNKNKEQENLLVDVTLKFITTIDDIEVINAKVTMIGIFRCSENLELSEDTFGKINAPAIIFPFIREHLANLSLKAGIPPILLPPVNFVQLDKLKKDEETKAK